MGALNASEQRTVQTTVHLGREGERKTNPEPEDLPEEKTRRPRVQGIEELPGVLLAELLPMIPPDAGFENHSGEMSRAKSGLE